MRRAVRGHHRRGRRPAAHRRQGILGLQLRNRGRRPRRTRRDRQRHERIKPVDPLHVLRLPARRKTRGRRHDRRLAELGNAVLQLRRADDDDERPYGHLRRHDDLRRKPVVFRARQNRDCKRCDGAVLRRHADGGRMRTRGARCPAAAQQRALAREVAHLRGGRQVQQSVV